MRKRDEWIERVKAVELEYLAARFAVEVLRDRLRVESHALPTDLELADVNRMASNLETTYLIRLFAVFEAGLRDAWRMALGRDTQPLMRDLLDGIASARRIQHPILEAAHRAREYRNECVHEHDPGSGGTFTMGEVRRHLTRYFSHLPPNW